MAVRRKLKYALIVIALLIASTFGYCLVSYQQCMMAIGSTENIGAAMQMECPGFAPAVGEAMIKLVSF